jgi:hypothetical protein
VAALDALRGRQRVLFGFGAAVFAGAAILNVQVGDEVLDPILRGIEYVGGLVFTALAVKAKGAAADAAIAPAKPEAPKP